MLFWTTIKLCLKALLANKMRSFLAMLGIIIGVAAVIAMLGIGSGARKQMLDNFAAMGSNLLMVTPGQQRQHGGGAMAGTFQNLRVDDALALGAEVPGLARVVPCVRRNYSIKYMNQNTSCAVFGTSPEYLNIRDIKIDGGEAFSQIDIDHNARVAIIGSQVRSDLFGENYPVGETIKINGISFRVVALTVTKGESWSSPDNWVIIPYTTAMKQVMGVDYINEIDMQAQNEDQLGQVQADVETLLGKRHRLQEGQASDFSVTNMADIRKQADAMLGIFRALLASIAAVSLLVGGIGIMNIMLVTVTERTREIGIRKAIGAKQRHILSQFLLESVIISGLGGGLGVALGVGAAWMLPRFVQQFKSLVEPSAIVLALGFSAFVGIFFGFYPAWRASRLNPVDALRYE